MHEVCHNKARPVVDAAGLAGASALGRGQGVAGTVKTVM